MASGFWLASRPCSARGCPYLSTGQGTLFRRSCGISCAVRGRPSISTGHRFSGCVTVTFQAWFFPLRGRELNPDEQCWKQLPEWFLYRLIEDFPVCRRTARPPSVTSMNRTSSIACFPRSLRSGERIIFVRHFKPRMYCYTPQGKLSREPATI